MHIYVRNKTEKIRSREYFLCKIILRLSLYYETWYKNFYIDWFIIRKVMAAKNLQYL